MPEIDDLDLLPFCQSADGETASIWQGDVLATLGYSQWR